jgi:hypothetical protein
MSRPGTGERATLGKRDAVSTPKSPPTYTGVASQTRHVRRASFINEISRMDSVSIFFRQKETDDTPGLSSSTRRFVALGNGNLARELVVQGRVAFQLLHALLACTIGFRS